MKFESFERLLALPDLDRKGAFEVTAVRLDMQASCVEWEFWCCLVLDVPFFATYRRVIRVCCSKAVRRSSRRSDSSGTSPKTSTWSSIARGWDRSASSSQAAQRAMIEKDYTAMQGMILGGRRNSTG